MSTFNLQVGSATDVGQLRKINQDSIVTEGDIYGVADGMGGHQGGEVASAVAVQILSQGMEAATPAGLEAAVKAANLAVYEQGQARDDLAGMGTTLVAISEVEVDDEPHLVIVNVGDSRGYLLRDRDLVQITEDHSLVADLVRAGRITPEEAETHPRRNIVTRVLGLDDNVRVDQFAVLPFEGDRYLMCSDGLTNEVSEADITSTLRRIDDPVEAANVLVRMANEGGGRDNISVVIVDVLDDDGQAVRASVAIADEPSGLESRDDLDELADAAADDHDEAPPVEPSDDDDDELGALGALGAAGVAAGVGFGAASTAGTVGPPASAPPEIDTDAGESSEGPADDSSPSQLTETSAPPEVDDDEADDFDETTEEVADELGDDEGEPEDDLGSGVASEADGTDEQGSADEGEPAADALDADDTARGESDGVESDARAVEASNDDADDDQIQGSAQEDAEDDDRSDEDTEDDDAEDDDRSDEDAEDDDTEDDDRSDEAVAAAAALATGTEPAEDTNDTGETDHPDATEERDDTDDEKLSRRQRKKRKKAAAAAAATATGAAAMAAEESGAAGTVTIKADKAGTVAAGEADADNQPEGEVEDLAGFGRALDDSQLAEVDEKVAVEDQEELDELLPKRKRFSWRVAAFLFIFCAVIGVAAGALGVYARGTYYVGFDNDRVTVFQGRPGGVLIFDPTVEADSNVLRPELLPVSVEQVEAEPDFSSIEEADVFINNLQLVTPDKVPVVGPPGSFDDDVTDNTDPPTETPLPPEAPTPAGSPDTTAG